MFPGLGGGLDPKKMKSMMNKLGIKTEDIDADEVIIKGKYGKDIIIKDPSVTAIDTQGQRIFQVVGRIEEEEGSPFSEEDVKLVMEKTGASEEKAKAALEKSDGEIAKAIVDLS